MTRDGISCLIERLRTRNEIAGTQIRFILEGDPLFFQPHERSETMKHFQKSFGVVFILVGLFLVASSVNSYAADYRIRVANPVAADHSWGRAAEYFKQEVEKASGGKISVEVHHVGALGKVRETMEMVRMGTLETALGGVANFQRNVPRIGHHRSSVPLEGLEDPVHSPRRGSREGTREEECSRRASTASDSGITASGTYPTAAARSRPWKT